MPRPRIKVCCIANVEEARLAIDAGASALGLVSKMPSGPGPISDDQIAQIAPLVPPGVDTFLLTAWQDAESILEQHARCRTSTLQLVDEVPVAELQILRQKLPGIRLVQAIHVCGEQSVAAAKEVAPHVDAILLDSGNQQLEIKELGGTGRVHDWQLSRQIRDECGRPIFLAGGLSAANVAQAITQVEPFGLDLCSSLRTDGKLDRTKLNAFFAAVNLTAPFSAD